MSANPIGIVIALVAGLVTAFVVLWNKSEGFREFWIGLWEKIKSVAEPVINGLVEWFSNAWDKIKSVWDGVKPYFQLIWDFIKAVFSGNVVAFFFKEFSGAWSKIKEVFAPFGNFFKGLWNNVKNTFTNLGTKIGDAIGKAVKAGINGVISQIERVINSGIDLINGAIRLINLLPGVNVGKVGNVRFPRLARGGVVDSATFAEIGEAGAEAVVPLENNTGWITKIAQQLATSLVPAIANATKSVTSANYNNNSYNDTVEAFKDALGQMKIVLDDEAMGDFVEKTVADAIYT
jgi:phage-related protein